VRRFPPRFPRNAGTTTRCGPLLAWGRDFGDVTPMRGVILGGGTQSLAVRVTVTPRSEAPLESELHG